MVSVPVRGLVHRKEQDDAVDNRQGADQIANAPVLDSGCASCERDLTIAEAGDDGVRVRADRSRNETSDNPAHDHEGHAERDEDATLLGRHALGEHGRDDRDARANAKAGDETERAEERVVRRKSLGKGKQTIEDNCDREHLLTADHVGEDTSDGTTKNHAEQAPSSQRAGQSRDGLTSSNLSCKERRCDIGVGGIDDHEVVAVENHGERQEDEYDPCVGGNARTVNDFGNSKLFTVHQSLLKSIFSIRRNEYSGKPPAFPTARRQISIS